MSKSTRIINPKTGTPCFGIIPAIARLETERAPIYLLKGDHFVGAGGRGHGFGEKHILAGHRREIAEAKCDGVAEFIAKLVYAGVPVCSEGVFTQKTRVLAMRHSRTVVALEYRDGRNIEPHWSIVTAFIRGGGLPVIELARVEAPE